ncbi:formate dehydrogenase accessory sulfurtransferase FdhD [Bradyrhizobium sp. Arg68]|uniref:formate dehydrogenase accessory sulfurtransferase FdhD n=1 Tax=Bradyrhizobium ivorense TaxID=2511166 RepID=UPI001E3B5201|nr:formate dehydrogenase accessory sulfurtransferase FdhD [Bradyrhizobium ivorense]MCC8936168.1 formate dehydrogenase accessory sulfurtransferase FdhD [Bradyrhizobium ivorense]
MTNQTLSISVRRLAFNDRNDGDLVRAVPVETPVAIEVCGIGYAVMMATPSDLRDYAAGFALAEGLVKHVQDLSDIIVHETEGGSIIRLTLPAEGTAIALERARRRVSESSCGLCGLENIQQVLRPLPPIRGRITTSREAIADALNALQHHQTLGRSTGGTHAAAFCCPDGSILCVREDIGRHNALDKLIGALALSDIPASGGFLLLSARCSYELVEKAVRAGCPMLVTISAPTSLAVERAEQAGLTLVALARPDSALIVCDVHRNIS